MNLAVRDDPQGALPLMETVLRDGGSLAPDYPLVFEEGRSGRVVIAEDGGSVRSTCALLERDLIFGEDRISVGLIGSVSTAEDFRGRGLATAVLDHAEAELLKRGCFASLLWADSAEFYLGRGYREIGSECDFGLPHTLAPFLPLSESVVEAHPSQFAELHELYCDHSSRVDRQYEESCALYATPGMQIVVELHGGHPVAYACYGRGHDLQGVIHEWAGETEGVLACIRSLIEEHTPTREGQAIFLMAPDLESGEELTRRLLDADVPSAHGVLAMGKLLDVGAATDRVRAASSDPLVVRLVSDQSVEFTGPAGSLACDASDLMELLLPPRGDRTFLKRAERTLGVEFPALPLNPFLWGLDSI